MKKLEQWELNVLKQNLPDYAERYLKKSKRKKYCCPNCGSGTGNNGKYTGALGIHKAEDGNTPLFTCRACGATGNIFKLVMLNERLDFPSALKRVRELYDPSYNPFDDDDDERTVKRMTNTTPPAVKPQAQPVNPAVQNTKPAVIRDFRNFYRMCERNIKKTDYPRKRGLDDATVKRFHLGYASDWYSPTGAEQWTNGTPPKSPRLIIPVDANHYTARDTREDSELTESQKDFKKQQEGKDGPPFNLEAMNNRLCFFCCEGEIDAMSIEQAGGSCVAYRSAGNKARFCEILGNRDAMKTGTVVIVQDNDKTGKDTADYIENFCREHGFLFTRKNVSGPYKDPNEFLVNNRNAFENTVKNIIQEIRNERMQDYMEDNSVSSAVDIFMHKTGTENDTIPTGFPIMDEFLDGGLHPGLYFLGAVSSIGKTTFALQIAENVVSRGRPVMFFSLEQSREDLVSKSLSRRTYEKSLAKKKNESLAKTNMTILRRETWQKWSQAEWDNFWECMEECKRTQKQLKIIEAVGDYGVDEIEEDVKEFVSVTGLTPLVIIDYLQILKPYDERMGDKQNVDRTTSALKRLSRDYNLTIIAISSFNRESYWQQVTLTSFKESGSVEYSSDVLLALSPAGMVEASSDNDKKSNKQTITKTKVAKVRQLELHVLKNRNGRITNADHKLQFDYTAMFNHFKETKHSYLSNFDDGPSL